MFIIMNFRPSSLQISEKLAFIAQQAYQKRIKAR